MQEYKQFMKKMAVRSREISQSLFFKPDLNIDYKADRSPVTEADRATEQFMRDMIRDHYPQHGIIGEEHGDVNPDAEYVWTLDPIDGTVSFTHGVPLFGTMAALLHQGRPVLGMVYQPVSDILCLGDGTTTEINDRPVRMRSAGEMAEADLLTTDIKNIRKHQNYDGFENLMRQTNLFRTWGDCYGYLLLAAGMADIMVDPVLNIWDLMPLIPIIEGAGGKLTSWQGEDILKADSCVAAHPDLHGQVLKVLNS